MGSVKSIEEAVEALSADELTEFRRWFEQFDAAVWDARLEADASAGKLDTLVAEALAEYGEGKAREL